MPATWLQIEVELLGKVGMACDPPPGRILIAGGSHTFADLARAIDTAFARWDAAHGHGFALPGGRLIGLAELELDEDGPVWEAEDRLLLTDELDPGDEFDYLFQLGDEWRHRCVVLDGRVDPRGELGEVPLRPAPIWGWGSIPDQYGRVRSEHG